MLQVENETPFATALTVLPDASGVDTVYAIVKGTFTLGQQLGLAEEQVPVTLADQHYGDPATSSIRQPSDVCLGKPGTDVLLIGSAWAPGGRPAYWMDVALAVGPVAKTVRVFGDRVWDAGPAGAVPSPPAAFERMPLAWERAFGGSDVTQDGPTAEPRNPVGSGFRVSNGAKELRGLPLPNLEDPASPITSWQDRPAPACFAPIAGHWQPRLSFAGTYDESWQATRAPFLPQDFDARFFQVAPTDLVVRGYLRGGELVGVRGATPSGWLQFVLPTIRIRVTYTLDDRHEQPPVVLDTVVIEPDAGRCVLTWRAALRCDKRVLKVRQVRVSPVGAA
jgi:hypothetical protein